MAERRKVWYDGASKDRNDSEQQQNQQQQQQPQLRDRQDSRREGPRSPSRSLERHPNDRQRDRQPTRYYGRQDQGRRDAPRDSYHPYDRRDHGRQDQSRRDAPRDSYQQYDYRDNSQQDYSTRDQRDYQSRPTQQQRDQRDFQSRPSPQQRDQREYQNRSSPQQHFVPPPADLSHADWIKQLVEQALTSREGDQNQQRGPGTPVFGGADDFSFAGSPRNQGDCHSHGQRRQTDAPLARDHRAPRADARHDEPARSTAGGRKTPVDSPAVTPRPVLSSVSLLNNFAQFLPVEILDACHLGYSASNAVGNFFTKPRLLAQFSDPRDLAVCLGISPANEHVLKFPIEDILKLLHQACQSAARHLQEQNALERLRRKVQGRITLRGDTSKSASHGLRIEAAVPCSKCQAMHFPSDLSKYTDGKQILCAWCLKDSNRASCSSNLPVADPSQQTFAQAFTQAASKARLPITRTKPNAKTNLIALANTGDILGTPVSENIHDDSTAKCTRQFIKLLRDHFFDESTEVQKWFAETPKNAQEIAKFEMFLFERLKRGSVSWMSQSRQCLLRLIDWCEDRGLDFKSLSGKNTFEFLFEQFERGQSVPKSELQRLNYLFTRLGFPLAEHIPFCDTLDYACGLRAEKSAYTPDEIVRLEKLTRSMDPVVALEASFVLMTVWSGSRAAHIQRSRLIPEESDISAEWKYMTFSCFKAKAKGVKQKFKYRVTLVSITGIAWWEPAWGHLTKRLNHNPRHDFLFERDGCYHMVNPLMLPPGLITKRVRGLLIIAGVAPDIAEMRSGHSGRRFGPTMGTLCGIALQFLYSLGLWMNPLDTTSSNIMPQRYNDKRLLEADSNRRKICDHIKAYFEHKGSCEHWNEIEFCRFLDRPVPAIKDIEKLNPAVVDLGEEDDVYDLESSDGITAAKNKIMSRKVYTTFENFIFENFIWYLKYFPPKPPPFQNSI